MIRITSKYPGFRRCGIAHSKEPTDYPADRFSKKELAALKAEPMLVVEEVEEPKKGKEK
ncbi:MAG: HI1506-related protein [Desulfuromonadales bacterium]|nr:HI1506-related protein [Desulfuromonadales bacterium]